MGAHLLSRIELTIESLHWPSRGATSSRPPVHLDAAPTFSASSASAATARSGRGGRDHGQTPSPRARRGGHDRLRHRGRGSTKTPDLGSRNGIPSPVGRWRSTPARRLLWQADHACDGGGVADLVWSGRQIGGLLD
jgi:hypothetical protein